MVRPFCGMDIICGEPGLFVCKLLTGKVNVIGFPCWPTPRIIFTVPGVVWIEFVLLATADVIVFTCDDDTNDTKLFADEVTIEPVCTVRMPAAVVTKMICWFVRIGRPDNIQNQIECSLICDFFIAKKVLWLTLDLFIRYNECWFICVCSHFAHLNQIWIFHKNLIATHGWWRYKFNQLICTDQCWFSTMIASC